MDLPTLERLNCEIRERYPDSVLDGIVDANQFARTKPRILWILREANGGKGWDLRSWLRDLLGQGPGVRYPDWWRVENVRVGGESFSGRS